MVVAGWFSIGRGLLDCVALSERPLGSDSGDGADVGCFMSPLEALEEEDGSALVFAGGGAGTAAFVGSSSSASGLRFLVVVVLDGAASPLVIFGDTSPGEGREDLTLSSADMSAVSGGDVSG